MGLAMPSEAEMAWESLDDFINENPVEITILRYLLVSDGAGGYRSESTPTAFPLQKVRLCDPGLVSTSGRVNTVEGKYNAPTMNLVGYPDANIQVLDKFAALGCNWSVREIRQRRDLGVSAVVVNDSIA